MLKSVTTAIVAIAGLSLSASAQLVTPATSGTTAPQARSDAMSRAAATYATYHGDVTDVKTNGFNSANDIDDALTNLGGHNSDLLTNGWMAYSALIAAQDSEFRAAVMDIQDFYGRDVLMTGLKNDVRYARSLNGGTNAFGASLTAINADSRRLINTAALVKEQAYSLQGAGWAKGKVGNSGARADLLLAKTNSGIPARGALVSAFSDPSIDNVLQAAGQTGSGSVWEAVNGVATAIRVPTFASRFGTSRAVARGQEPVADAITTLAAYRILGADPSSETAVRSAMQERETSNCVKSAQLNLMQCVAAAYKHYEVPFCIGEHALSDVGKCIGKVSS